MEEPSFEELAEFIRDQCGLKHDERIVPESQLEHALGITGDDGCELLEAVEKRFGVTFTPKSFGLEANEYLFHSEGLDLIPAFVRRLFRKPEPEIRSFTAGELLEAVRQELKKEDHKEA